MEHKGEKIVVGVALIIVIAGIVWFFWYRSTGGELTSFVGKGEELIRPIRKGTIVSSFPKEFIPEESVAIRDSYALRYTEEVIQPVLEYESSLSLEENLKIYYDVLVSYNWNITHLASPYESPTFYYAALDGKEVNISFRLQEGRVAITISYIAPL